MRQPAWRWWLLVIFLALVPRLAWAALMLGREPRYDEIQYVGHAARLCAGQGYVDAVGAPADYWPVGFPLVLALTYCAFGTHLQTGVALQIVLGVFTCALVGWLGERFVDRAVGRTAALVLAFYPTAVMYGTLQVTEPLSTVLLLGVGGLLLWSLRGASLPALAAGALLGFAILTRPVLVALLAMFPAWYIANGVGPKRVLLLGGLIAGTALVVISPWLARNHDLTGSWTDLSSTGGYNFLLGNYPGAWGGYRPVPELAAEAPTSGHFDPSLAYRRGLEEIRVHPVDAMRRAVQKISYFFALETDGVLWNLKGLRSPPPLWVTLVLLSLANVAYVTVASGCVLGLLGPWPNRALPSLFLTITGCLVLIAIIFVGDPRYHFLLMPSAALIFAKALLHDGPRLWDGLRRRDRGAQSRLRYWMMVNAALALLMLGNIWLKHLEMVGA
jgi:4-amino-4-deoxy-L-arabinose transferase-like glycosyltransferase